MNDYYKQGRWELLSNQHGNLKKNGYSSILFGNSMTENFAAYLPVSDSIINMGISGDFSEGLIKRIDNVINFQPNNIFIMIGINDIIEKVPLSVIQENYLEILELIETNCPNTKIYIQSTLPTRDLESLISSSYGINKNVQALNLFLNEISNKKGITFIDMYSEFTNENNELSEELTTDGIHLTRAGYNLWITHLENQIQLPKFKL